MASKAAELALWPGKEQGDRVQTDIRLLGAERLESDLQQAFDSADFAAAEKIARQVVAMRTAALTANHPDVAVALLDVAEACRQQRHWAEASEVLLQARTIESKHGDPDRQARVLNALANIHMQQHDFAAAVPLFEEAEQLLASASPDTRAIVQGGLATAYRCLGRSSDAERLLLLILPVFEQRFGQASTELVQPLSELAALYAVNDPLKAEPFYAHICKLFEKSPHRSVMSIAIALLDHSRCLIDCGKLDVAERQLGKAVTLLAEVGHDGHGQAAAAQLFLGEIADRQRDFPKAIAAYQSAVELYRAALGPAHPQVGVALTNLAMAQAESGDYAASDDLAKQAHAVFIGRFGRDHAHTLALEAALAIFTSAMDKASAWRRCLFDERSVRIVQVRHD